MIFEKIIFNILAFTLFTIIFMKMIKKNDTSYVYVLGIEFIGIVLNFVELFINVRFNLFFRMVMYLLSVIIPSAILIIEYKKKLDFPELFRVTMAKIYMNLGKNDEAKDYLFSLINKYPESYLGHKLLAELYEKEGKRENAIDEYIRVTEINSKDLNINYNIAKLLNQEQRREEAVSILQDMLKKKPESYEATKLLGDILFSEEQYKEAISVYMNALRYHPGNYDLYYNLGMTYTMVNDFQRAKEFYDKAAEINSLLYNAKLSLGQIALIYGDLDEAEQYFNESLKGENVESGSYYYLSQIALLRGDKEKATNYMNVAIGLDPKLYDKAQKENVFTPIKKEVIEPTEEARQSAKKNELPPKDKRCINHLSKTCTLVSSLNNDDIKMMANVKKKERQKQQDKQRGEY